MLTELEALTLLRDGYYKGCGGGSDDVKPYFLIFENPKYQEDNGENPNLLYEFSETEAI